MTHAKHKHTHVRKTHTHACTAANAVMKRGEVSKTFHVGPGKISADVWPLLQSVKATFVFVCVLERSSRRGCGSRADSSRESWEGWQLDQREIHVFCSVGREVQRFLNGMTRLFVICVLGDINAPPMNIPISETLLIQSGRGQEQHDNMYKYFRNIQKKTTKNGTTHSKAVGVFFFSFWIG